MRRFDESQQSDYERSLKLGHDNAECLHQMHGWCKHVAIKKVSEGLYAQITGLPIATHSLGCPYVQGESHAMNLRWIFTDFLVKHCAVCTNHVPNGNMKWAEKIIDDNRLKMQIHEREIKEENERIARLRLDMLTLSKNITAKVEPESQRILEFLEAFFAEDEESRKLAAERLKQSAQLAADLFPDEVVNLILVLATSVEFSRLILPICVELASRRADLCSCLYKLSLNNIEKGLHIELSASVFDALGNTITYPLNDTCIEKLMLSQNHDRFFGGGEDGKPVYPYSTAIIVRCIDAEQQSVQQVARRNLEKPNDYLRVQLCGALELIQEKRPLIVINLLDDLVRSLEMYEDERAGIETPSGKIVHLLQAAFRYSPQLVDKLLSDSFFRVRPTIQEDIVKIYRDQFFDDALSWEQRHESKNRCKVSENEEVAIQRLLTWMKDDRIEIDIRSCSIEAFEMACSYATAGVLPHFNSLLGFAALVSSEKNPPAASPKIFLPGPKDNPELESLNNFSRIQQWGIFKQHLHKCLEEICKNRPTEGFDLVSGCLNQSYDQLEDGFKATCVSLLGQLGKDYQLRSQVLPLVWRALMDYSSTWVRSVAINATVEMFSCSSASPPSNLVDAIIVHLQDPVIVVHQSALRAVSRHSSWFDDKQALEVLSCLAGHLKAYKNDKYQLDDICDGILAVGLSCERYMVLALHMVEHVFPTGEELVDSKIAENLIRFCKPTEPMAHLVAKNIATYLGRYDRDHSNYYGHSKRFRMFWWLHELPMETYRRVEGKMLSSAMEMAKRDAWESSHFASLFAQNRAFKFEFSVLESAAKSLPEEPRYELFRDKLRKLAVVAEGNEALAANDLENANKYFANGARDV